MRESLTEIAATVDAGFPESASLGIDERGLLVLKRITLREPRASTRNIFPKVGVTAD